MQYIITWYALTAATLAMWFFVKPAAKAKASTVVKRRLPPTLRGA